MSSARAGSARRPPSRSSRRFSRCRCSPDRTPCASASTRCSARSRCSRRTRPRRSSASPARRPAATATPPSPASARSRGKPSASACRLAVEPFQREGIESWSILNTLGDAAEFIDEVGSDAVGIQFDVWHLWNTPDLFEEIERYAAPHRGRPRLRLARADARLGRPRLARRRRCRRPGRSSARSTTPAGTATTTSRSSPTTALSERRIQTRSGISTPPSSRAAVVTLSSTAGTQEGRCSRP